VSGKRGKAWEFDGKKKSLSHHARQAVPELYQRDVVRRGGVGDAQSFEHSLSRRDRDDLVVARRARLRSRGERGEGEEEKAGESQCVAAQRR
jgi:hypothetical protein